MIVFTEDNKCFLTNEHGDDHPDFEGIKPNEFVVMKSTPSASAAIGRHREGEITLLPEFGAIWGVKPRNKEQRFAFDLLFDPTIKLDRKSVV